MSVYENFLKEVERNDQISKILSILQTTSEVNFLDALGTAIHLRVDELENKIQSGTYDTSFLKQRIVTLKNILTIKDRLTSLNIFA